MKKFKKKKFQPFLIFNDILSIWQRTFANEYNFQVGSGFGSGYIIQDYRSKDPDQKENQYGSASLVFRVKIATAKRLKRVTGKIFELSRKEVISRRQVKSFRIKYTITTVSYSKILKTISAHTKTMIKFYIASKKCPSTDKIPLKL